MKSLNDLLYDTVEVNGDIASVRIGIATPQTVVPASVAKLSLNDLMSKSFAGENKIRIYKP